MMKRFLAGLVSLAMAASIFTFGYSSVSMAAENTATETAAVEITEAEAIQIAYTASKYSDKVIQYTKAWKASDNGKDVYKVEFYVGKARFGYTIDVATGEIIKKYVKD